MWACQIVNNLDYCNLEHKYSVTGRRILSLSLFQI